MSRNNGLAGHSGNVSVIETKLVDTTETGTRATNPPLAWSQEADAAIVRGDMAEALDMIRFAYWSVDAACDEAESDQPSPKKPLIGKSSNVLSSSRRSGSTRSMPRS